jgi:WD40 repeat protein
MEIFLLAPAFLMFWTDIFKFPDIFIYPPVIQSLRSLPKSAEMFVSAGREGSLCIWNACSMKQMERISPIPHGTLLSAMVISPGGGLLACGYDKGSLSVFTVQNRVKLFALEVSDRPITSVSFDPAEGKRCMCVTDCGFVCVVDIEARAIVETFLDSGFARFGAFSLGGFAVAGVGGSVQILLPTHQVIQVSLGDVSSIAWLPFHEAAIFVAGSRIGDIILCDCAAASATVVGAVRKGYARCLAFHSLLSDIVVAGNDDGFLSVHDITQ